MDNEKIIQVKKLFHDYEAKSIQAVCNCDYDELAQEIVKLFAIPEVVGRSEQLCQHENIGAANGVSMYCKDCKKWLPNE